MQIKMIRLNVTTIITSLLFLGASPAICFQVDVLLDKTMIDPGQTVTISAQSNEKIKHIDAWITTPLKHKHKLEFTPKGAFRFISHFEKTQERGFLTADWNIYHLNAKVRNIRGEEKEISKAFHLKESAKTLYFAFWVDDFGAAGELKKEFRDWYHVHAGPISYALEKDDTAFYNLRTLLSKYDFTRDYLSHHFHPFHWEKNRLLLYANHLIYVPYLNLRNHTNSWLGFQLVRTRNISLIAMLFTALFLYRYLRYKRNKSFFLSILLITSLFIFIGLRYNHIYITNYENWKFELTNAEWCKRFLINAKKEFNDLGYLFPPVVRHGWNLPPKGIMKFYMSNMGVLADASAISGVGLNDYLKNLNYYARTINWPNTPIPYYASLTQDYNVRWNGTEEDRGILELPLTFRNFGKIDVDSSVIQKITALPNGAFVSTYLHPNQKTENLRELVNYLNASYQNIKYITPDQYLNIYMKHHPRPILVDKKLVPHWAFLRNETLFPIRRTNAIDFRLGLNIDNKVTHSLSVETFDRIPILQIMVPQVKCALFDGEELPIVREKETYIWIKNVEPGIHTLELID